MDRLVVVKFHINTANAFHDTNKKWPSFSVHKVIFDMFR